MWRRTALVWTLWRGTWSREDYVQEIRHVIPCALRDSTTTLDRANRMSFVYVCMYVCIPYVLRACVYICVCAFTHSCHEYCLCPYIHTYIHTYIIYIYIYIQTYIHTQVHTMSNKRSLCRAGVFKSF